MCGIVGIAGSQEPGWIEAMNGLIVHRGPDGHGTWRSEDGRLALAMRRLAILDIEGGRQPMSTPDGRFTIVFNGEIYNTPDLRRDLAARGADLRTDHSDTEAVLHGYALDGPAILDRLNGMFAFAIHDRDRGLVFCARDRLGIKPLYYTTAGGRLAFASELKSLLALPFVERRLDRQSLFHYMSLLYVPGEASILEGISRLEPGHSLTFRLDGATAPQVRRWWRLSFAASADVPARDADLEAWLRDGIRRAVERWSLSDVPVGCLLSGGLDSTSIVALLASAGHDVATYTVGFTGAGEDQFNELPLARLLARRYGTRHQDIVLDPEALLDDLGRMVWHLDEPYGGGLPSWSVFRFMGGKVKVAMTGTGGDELFGNYDKYRGLEGGRLARLVGRRPDLSADAFRRGFFERWYYLSDADKRAAVLADAGGFADTSALLYDRFRAADSGDLRDGAALADVETQLAEEFLLMTDRLSMAHGVEARTPFLDHELVGMVMAVPAARRLDRRRYKGLLVRVVRDLLPDELVNAPKRGFVIPLKLWLRGRLRPLVQELLSPDRLAGQGLFRPDFHARYVVPHLDGHADNTQVVWAAMMFQLWHRTFLERRDVSQPLPDLTGLLAA